MASNVSQPCISCSEEKLAFLSIMQFLSGKGRIVRCALIDTERQFNEVAHTQCLQVCKNMLLLGSHKAIETTRQHGNVTCPRRIVRCARIFLNWSHERSSTHSMPPLVQRWQSLGNFVNKRHAHKHTVASIGHTLAKATIGLVAHLLNYREDCLAFWLIIPPLLIVPSLACSVTSLSLCPEP